MTTKSVVPGCDETLMMYGADTTARAASSIIDVVRCFFLGCRATFADRQVSFCWTFPDIEKRPSIS